MIKKIIWTLGFVIILIGLSPVQIPKKWHDDLGENYMKGYYYQTTGGGFYIEKALISGSFKLSVPLNEVNLIGNTPAKKFGFDRHYDIMSSDFILKGEIVGIDTIENVAFNC